MGELGAKGAKAPLSSPFPRAISQVVVFLALGSFICLLGRPARARHADSSQHRSTGFASNQKPGQAQIRAAYAYLPLAFEANVGQVRGKGGERVRFVARFEGSTVFLTPTEAVVSLSRLRRTNEKPQTVRSLGRPQPQGEQIRESAFMRMKFVGMNSAAKVQGLEELPGKTNYFLGNNPTKWRTNIPAYTKVKYQELYPGIDLVFYGTGKGLEYDWIVKPGGNPRSIRMALDGEGKPAIDSGGDLVFSGRDFQFRYRKPRVFQEGDGAQRAVDGCYVLNNKREVSFDVGPYDGTKPLIIDPVFSYVAVVGGSGQTWSLGSSQGTYVDTGMSIAVDASGSAYVTGTAYSPDFPTVGAVQATNRGSWNAFIMKLNPAGSAIVYSTYLGGSTFDQGFSIAVDPEGNAYVSGRAGADFPMVRAIQPMFGGQADAFVAKLNPAGSSLIYSTYLGGSGADDGNSIAVDLQGNAYVTGSTNSVNFPTTPGAFQGTLRLDSCPCCYEAFVAKISPGGSRLLYSTYLGGGSDDRGFAIAADSDGNAYVTGETYSRSNFPVTSGAFQTSLGPPNCNASLCGVTSCSAAFVTKLNPAGSDLVYSTFLGGESGLGDRGMGIAVDSAGNTYVAGQAVSRGFPTTPGALPRSGNNEAFITKLNPSGSELIYSTPLGGSSFDGANAIAVDSEGNAYVAGWTYSRDFPLKFPLQAGFVDGPCSPPIPSAAFVCTDGFVAKLNPTGTGLIYSTYFGGSGVDAINGIALDRAGNAYVTGVWRSGLQQLRWQPSLQASRIGGFVFVAKISESGVTPAFTAASTTNAASFRSRGLTPGGLYTIFGQGLSNVSGVVTPGGFPLPTEMQGTSVTLGSLTVPLLALANVNGNEQINFQVPFEVLGPPTLTVINNGVRSLPVGTFWGADPGIFTLDGTNGAIQHGADFALVTADNPAAQGEVIVIYATGLGDVQPRPATGQPASASPLSRTVMTPTVTVGGASAEVLYSGLTPGFAGLYQVNVRVPQSAPAGNVDVVIQMGGQSSNAVKLPVR